MTEPVRIDGSQGEGGGQILRTAVSLAAIIGRPIEVTGIRAKRDNPGLRPQHMTGVKILADLFHAEVENLQVGAEWVRFAPSDKFAGGPLKVDVGTAGSIPMILMAVVPAVSLSNNSLEIEITGGTDVRASPTIDYVRHVVADAYRNIGIKFSIEVLKRGYYPKGGGIVQARDRVGRARQELREAEVEHLHQATIGTNEIRGLDVAMDDAAAVRLVERVGHLDGGLDRFADWKRALRGPRRQHFSFHELHHDEVGPVELADVVGNGDIGGTEERGGARLVQQPCPAFGVRFQRRREEFQGDRTSKSQVVSTIDLSHPPGSQPCSDAIVLNRCADVHVSRTPRSAAPVPPAFALRRDRPVHCAASAWQSPSGGSYHASLTIRCLPLRLYSPWQNWPAR